MRFVFAAFALRSEWHRWVLMATIPLVAVAGNFVRMLMLYFGSKFFGTTFAIGEGEGNESFYHIASGLVVFVVALTMLSAFVEILKKIMNFWSLAIFCRRLPFPPLLCRQS